MRNARAVLFEAAAVALAGILLALAANAISPRGLRLGRNYFPTGQPPNAPLSQATNAATPAQTTNPTDVQAAALQRLARLGLQSISSNTVVALFHDPRREQGLVAFLDARADAPYQAGHIPGAWQFDHYRAEAFLPTVVPVCLSAQHVVIYCNGGSCEDSEFAAITLRDAGVPPANLFVYVGGITEWKTTGLPVETGARLSGQFLKPSP